MVIINFHKFYQSYNGIVVGITENMKRNVNYFISDLNIP